jgi:hypothetical protein
VCSDDGVLVTIVRGGGLSGLVRQTELDSALLPPDAAARLRELFDALPWERPSSAGGPDEVRYEVMVVDDDTTWSLRTHDRGLSDEERLLIAFVDGRDERVDSVSPP